MEREDPLERLERKEQERKANGGAKTVMYAMIAVAALLAGALAYVLIQKNTLVGQLNIEKQELTDQIVALQGDYEALSSDYDSINLQLDSSRIMIPDEMIMQRIQHRAAIEGRADDAKDEVITNRIRTYHEKTEPLIDFYKQAGRYHEIDGVGTIEEVRARIFDLMERL